MNTSNITNYKPKDFAELLGVSVKTLQRRDREGTLLHVFSCRLYGLCKYKKQIEGDEEIAKEFQDGNKSNSRAESQD